LLLRNDFSALVWCKGDRRSGLTRAHALIGVGLWLLVKAIPGLLSLLQLAPTPPAIALAVMAAAIALLLVAGRSSLFAVP
jgi:hypothetical protein